MTSQMHSPMSNSFREYTGGRIDSKVGTRQKVMVYKSLALSPRCATGGAALYLPHLRPKLDEPLSPRVATEKSVDSMSPVIKRRTIFSPVLKSRQSTAAESRYKVSVVDMVRSMNKNSTDPPEFNIKGYPEGLYPGFNAH